MNILIVEDELIISETLRHMLEDMGHLCSGTAQTLSDGLCQVEEQNYDLAILDINLEGDHEGIAIGKRCRDICKPFLFLTSYSDYETVLAAKEAKPGAYLIKPFTPQDILVAIEMTMMHQAADNQRGLDGILEKLDLSEREAEVLKCMAKRLSNSEIAEKLFVSNNTIKFHVKNLYTKLGVASRSEVLDRLEVLAD